MARYGSASRLQCKCIDDGLNGAYGRHRRVGRIGGSALAQSRWDSSMAASVAIRTVG